MPDREKVIKGLAACMPQTEEDAAIGCNACPYNGHPCGGDYQDNDHVNLPVAMIEDIRALLKAQEARVMALEEAQGADYCWYESRWADICILCDATIYPSHNGKPKTELQTMGTEVRGLQYDDAYGKDWRCWTSRPTDAQREAVKWE